MTKGEERGSEKNTVEKLELVLLCWLSVRRVIRLIMKLWEVVLIQIILFFENQVRGSIMIEGITI
ncbi:hypothetical protein NL489_26525, partial [Klebsiella pneumoniae]|nr:hypothetical protein [Klebsiella pneumoniae]